MRLSFMSDPRIAYYTLFVFNFKLFSSKHYTFSAIGNSVFVRPKEV